MPENEQAIFEEATDNVREAAQRIGAISNQLRATGMREGENHHGLVHRVASALASTEAAV